MCPVFTLVLLSFSFFCDDLSDPMTAHQHMTCVTQVQNFARDICLDTLEREDLDNKEYILGLYSCQHSPLYHEVRRYPTQSPGWPARHRELRTKVLCRK